MSLLRHLYLKTLVLPNLFAALIFSIFCSVALPAWASSKAAPPLSLPLAPPRVESLMRPKIYKKVMAEREVDAEASLEDLDGGVKKYSFHNAVLIHANVKQTHEVLTDYRVYAKIIPYIDEADFSPQTHVLSLRGGIWNFRLSSKIRFDDKSDRWVHFEFVGGHFYGMQGDIFFEDEGEKGTLVFMQGVKISGLPWPPKFVIERGAEIVFGFAAKRMRSYVENLKVDQKVESPIHEHDSNSPQVPELPRPRSHL